MIERQEQLLAEVLQKAVTVVNSIEERYREAAFPFVLQSFINVIPSSNSQGSQTETDSLAATVPRLSPTMSVNEFFHKATPDTHVSRFVCAAYYLLYTGKAEHFTQADILGIYERLREQKPKNPTDVLNQCIKKVYIIDGPSSEKQKCWVITSEGEKYVEGLLSNGKSTS